MWRFVYVLGGRSERRSAAVPLDGLVSVMCEYGAAHFVVGEVKVQERIKGSAFPENPDPCAPSDHYSFPPGLNGGVTSRGARLGAILQDRGGC